MNNYPEGIQYCKDLFKVVAALLTPRVRLCEKGNFLCVPLTVYYSIIPTDGLIHSIHLNLCTPSWIRDVLMENAPILFGTNLLVINNYAYDSIFKFIKEYISNLKGLDSQEIILKMNDLGTGN
jgi:hypothetical protein